MPYYFKSKKDIVTLECPGEKSFIEAWHETEPGFGIRIMRARKRDSAVLRVYLARYTDEHGKKRKKTLEPFNQMTFEDASNRVRFLRGSAKTERQTGVKAVPTLREVFEQYLAEKDDTLSPTSVNDYKAKFKHLKKYEDMPVTMLNQQWWQGLYRDLLTSSGKSGAVAVCRLAKMLYQMLVDLEQHIDKNPLNGLKQRGIFKKKPPKKNAIKRDKLIHVWNWMHTRAHTGVRDMMMIALLTGMRISVLGSLRWENVNMRTGYYEVPAEQKGNKTRVLVWVPIPDYLLENVFKPRFIGRGKSEWVIQSHRNGGEPLRDIRGSLQSLADETGISVSPHIMRKTFATIAHGRLKDLLTVARLLTHTTGENAVHEAVTAGYVGQEEDGLKKAVNDVADAVLAAVRPMDNGGELEELPEFPRDVDAKLEALVT